MRDYKGGYVIVDATGLHLDNAGKVVGLYQQIMNAVAVNKAVMLRNAKNGTEVLTPMYSTVAVDDISNSVSLNVYGGVITVYNDDDVTFTEAPDVKDVADDIATLKNDLVVENVRVNYSTSETINGATFYKFQGTATKAGYTPIGIVGVENIAGQPLLALHSFELANNRITIIHSSPSNEIEGLVNVIAKVLFRKTYTA